MKITSFGGSRECLIPRSHARLPSFDEVSNSSSTQLRGSQGLRTNQGRGDYLPKVFPLRLLTLRPLSQAWPFGNLRFPHQYLSGAAISPRVCIPPQLRPNGSSPACTGDGITVVPFVHSI